MDKTKYANLIAKYNVPGPRYTSYPTVPYWEDAPTEAQWISHLKQAVQESQKNNTGVSLYIHVPFCRSLCSYCGCNTTITRSKTAGQRYVGLLIQEWETIKSKISEEIKITEIHFGGGTPNFLTSQELQTLIQSIAGHPLDPTKGEYSYEADPRTLQEDQVKTMADLGFRRISFGVQDFDPKVQKIVNRVQPVEMVETCTQWARGNGYQSINFDLIYGLPFQTEESIRLTMNAVKKMMPDRIAFYAYAHVPWIKPSQRLYTEADLPKGDAKRKLYELGRSMLEDVGYLEVGMDHFSLPQDSLWKATCEGILHRNFMGYTTTKSKCLIGLGVSSISDSWTAFSQNYKTLEQYAHAVTQKKVPIFRGHNLNHEDLTLRHHILDLMCQFKTTWKEEGTGDSQLIQHCVDRLVPLEEDGLVAIHEHDVEVTELGRSFIRNICMAFDTRLWRKKPTTKLFSQTI